jgi:hypothetical protein
MDLDDFYVAHCLIMDDINGENSAWAQCYQWIVLK